MSVADTSGSSASGGSALAQAPSTTVRRSPLSVADTSGSGLDETVTVWACASNSNVTGPDRRRMSTSTGNTSAAVTAIWTSWAISPDTASARRRPVRGSGRTRATFQTASRQRSSQVGRMPHVSLSVSSMRRSARTRSSAASRSGPGRQRTRPQKKPALSQRSRVAPSGLTTARAGRSSSTRRFSSPAPGRVRAGMHHTRGGPSRSRR